ncbi:MAG: MMPL family transporter [Acidimicrobiales bacterium]
MHAFYAALGRFTVKFRWVIVVVWILGTVFAVKTLPSLGSVVNNNNSAFLPASAPDVRAANLAGPILGKQTLSPVLIVGYVASGRPTAADVAALQSEAMLARKQPNVVKVEFVGLSPDHKAIEVEALSQVQGFSLQAAEDTVNGIIGTFPQVHQPGLKLYVGGQVADEVYQNKQSNSTGNKTQGFSVLFIIVLLFLIFRSVVAPFVTLLPAVVVLELSGSIIGELGMHGLKVSQITQLLLIVIVLGAGTDYGLFLVFRVREGIRDGLNARDAVAKAVARVGESISASAGTVILALLSLLFATFGIYQDLGIPLAIGVACMLLAGLTLLPALLAILGRAAFWPSKPKLGQTQAGWWGRIAGRIVQRPAPTLIIGVLVFGALAIGSFWYQPAGFGGSTSAPAGTEAAIADNLIAAHFPKASSNPTNLVLAYKQSVWADPSVLVTAEKSLAASGQFSTINGPLSPSGAPITAAELTILHARLGAPKSLPPVAPAGVPLATYELYRSEALFVSTSGTVVQFEVATKAGDGNPGSTAALDAVPTVRATLARAAAASGAVDNGVAGEAAALYDISATSDSDLKHIIPLAAIAIAILLALVLRSLVAPFYLIASVVVSYLAALGFACLVFIVLGHSGGLTFLLPFLMFVFLLALGEDYNILVMTRIREEAHDHPLREAVVRAVGMTGPTITSAGLVLAGTFAVLTFAAGGGSGGSQIRDIGAGLGFGILMDTFLVRTLLVPSTVALLGKWNWWPVHVHEGMGFPSAAGPSSSGADSIAGAGDADADAAREAMLDDAALVPD